MGLPAAIAAWFAAAAIINANATSRFPAAAPVEDIIGTVVTVDLAIGALVFAVRVMYVLRHRVAAPGNPSDARLFAILAASFVGITLLVAVRFSIIWKVVASESFRYMEEAGYMVVVGLAVPVGILFAILGLSRAGGTASRVASWVSLGLGLLLTLLPLVASVSYALGLTD